MDFSILIPVYNSSINQLVEDLHFQAKALNSNFQILLIDDCSQLSCSYLNKKVALLENVTYQVLTNNIGRAAIRNLLFETAQYDKCIVLDGDVSIIKADFITTYLDNLTEQNIVVGGHVYQKEAPKNKAKYLHWLYGSKIESKTAAQRAKQPYASFMTSNFACSKTVFKQLKFEEQIKGYGHEDTLFGFAAQEKNIAIKHIENAVQHDGIDEVEVFLSKQKNAVQNLKKLYQNPKYKNLIAQHSKLIKSTKIPFLAFISKMFQTVLLKNLKSKQPNLKALQLMKLVWFKG